jgi:hypothetical protein
VTLKKVRFNFSSSIDADTKRNKIISFRFVCLNDRLCNEHKQTCAKFIQNNKHFRIWIAQTETNFYIFLSFSLQMKLFTLTLLALLQCLCFHEVSCNNSNSDEELHHVAPSSFGDESNNPNSSDHNSSIVVSEKK